MASRRATVPFELYAEGVDLHGTRADLAPGNPTRSYRSTAPVRVSGEIDDWQGHPPEQVETMLANLRRLRESGAAQIID